MPSLHDLIGEMSHMKVSDNDMDDCSSECSYYSLPGLEDDPWLKQIPAHEVRKQAELVPEEVSPFAKYPHRFYNKERLRLKTTGPWLEYPLFLSGRYHNGSYKQAGPARVIVNRAGRHEVIYHPRWDVNTFRKATYRKSGYRKQLPGYGSPVTAASLPTYPAVTQGYLSPPASPGFYGAVVYPWFTGISPQQAFALSGYQQWTGQSTMAGYYYPQNIALMAYY
ncbi:hypothetical protein ACHAPU_007135 [Fusarium lateritium]